MTRSSAGSRRQTPPAVHQDPHTARRHPSPRRRRPTSAVIRHPLDVALSDRDHGDNMRVDHARAPSGERRPASPIPTSSSRRKGQGTRRLPPMVHRQRQPADRQRSVRAGRLLPAGLDLLERSRRRQRPPVPLRRHVARSRRRDAPCGRRPRHHDRRGCVACLPRGGDDRFDAIARRDRGARTPTRRCGGRLERFFKVGGTRRWASHLTPGRPRPLPRSAPRS